MFIVTFGTNGFCNIKQKFRDAKSNVNGKT